MRNGPVVSSPQVTDVQMGFGRLNVRFFLKTRVGRKLDKIRLIATPLHDRIFYHGSLKIKEFRVARITREGDDF